MTSAPSPARWSRWNRRHRPPAPHAGAAGAVGTAMLCDAKIPPRFVSDAPFTPGPPTPTPRTPVGPCPWTPVEPVSATEGFACPPARPITPAATAGRTPVPIPPRPMTPAPGSGQPQRSQASARPLTWPPKRPGSGLAAGEGAKVVGRQRRKRAFGGTSLPLSAPMIARYGDGSGPS
jgi:hypothetical protein